MACYGSQDLLREPGPVAEAGTVTVATSSTVEQDSERFPKPEGPVAPTLVLDT